MSEPGQERPWLHLADGWLEWTDYQPLSPRPVGGKPVWFGLTHGEDCILLMVMTAPEPSGWRVPRLIEKRFCTPPSLIQVLEGLGRRYSIAGGVADRVGGPCPVATDQQLAAALAAGLEFPAEFDAGDYRLALEVRDFRHGLTTSPAAMAVARAVYGAMGYGPGPSDVR